MKKMIKLEYIWIDGYEDTPRLRSKTKIMIDDEFIGDQIDYHHLPRWSFDGSSTKQAKGSDSDCILQPVRLYNDPQRKNGYLVLCEVLNADNTPHTSNTRALLDRNNKDLWFGFEQEYVFMKDDKPLGWPEEGFPRPQGEYYCAVGTRNVIGREIVEKHLDQCMEAGLRITGINAEVMLGQWEYQLFGKGPKSSADDLWISRYLLDRICEEYDVTVTHHPKPVEGDWNGSGLHVNFSTSEMRDFGSEKLMNDICDTLQFQHHVDITEYGHDNDKRLTGIHETQHIDKFTYGVSDRGASIRIPIGVVENEWKGYLEDRRPAANADPYKLTGILTGNLESYFKTVPAILE